MDAAIGVHCFRTSGFVKLNIAWTLYQSVCSQLFLRKSAKTVFIPATTSQNDACMRVGSNLSKAFNEIIWSHSAGINISKYCWLQLKQNCWSDSCNMHKINRKVYVASFRKISSTVRKFRNRLILPYESNWYDERRSWCFDSCKEW